MSIRRHGDSSPVAIVGGGITGLSAAWELQRRAMPYIVLESANRLGGKLQTAQIDGFQVEWAADSFLTSNPHAAQLCAEIGLLPDLVPTNQIQRTVYIYTGGRLHPFPRGMRLIVPVEPAGLLESDLLSEQGKQRMLSEVDIPARSQIGDESLASFIERRFGREALQIFGEPLMSGIHVADPNLLSIDATFPQYPQMERTHGSVTAGMRATPPPGRLPGVPASLFVSPKAGMHSLITTLTEHLTGHVRTATRVIEVRDDRTVVLSTGEHIRTAGVIVATPARAAADMVRGSFPTIAAQLDDFTVASSAVISLAFPLIDVPLPLDGYGVVIPRREQTAITACTWSSTKLPGCAPAGYALLRVFVGGHGRVRQTDVPDDEMLRLARADLAAMLHITAPPVLERVHRFTDANPQYLVGHRERVAHLDATLPPWLRLAGCAYSGVGVPDCVRQGRSAAGTVSAISA